MTQAAALQKTVLQKQTAAAALEAQREALREQGAAQEALQAQKREQVEALRTQIAEQEAERSRASETLLRLQQQGTEYQLRQAELAENKYKLESQLERLSLSMENAQNKLWARTPFLCGQRTGIAGHPRTDPHAGPHQPERHRGI